MSGHKYANLPDIDTSPDVYETEDVVDSTHGSKPDSFEDDVNLASRSGIRSGRNNPEKQISVEELDPASLIPTDQATRIFKRAEKARDTTRGVYAHPPSPSSSDASDSPSRPVPLSHRLRNLQAEMSALELELADPSNAQLHQETLDGEVDPGEMLRGLANVRLRLGKLQERKEGRTRLMRVLLEDENAPQSSEILPEGDISYPPAGGKAAQLDIVDVDRRIGQLESLLGSSSVSLDEASPLPPALLPLLTRLNSQLNLLTQPRHIDSVSRRLKLLLSDLDRVSSTLPHRKHSSQTQPQGAHGSTLEQVLPLLSRLGPTLPQIPHILARLRTLASLHASAADFQVTMDGLEDEQRKALKT